MNRKKRKRYKKECRNVERWAAKHAGIMNGIIQYKEECWS